MMNPVAIRIENLSKQYRIGLKEKSHDTLGGTIASWIQAPLSNYKRLRNLTRFNSYQEEDVIWALKDISFDVEEGEVLGIVGRNGAGKSTLLKIISRITAPTTGRVTIDGRVSSLLEVGTGFHQELTGRDNVYLNGTLLGMSKREIDSKFDDIVDFAEISKFIDTPVKRYSSGMKLRLAFAVAAHLEPEIMLIDEVLAVGDTAFQKKCLGKMGDVARAGRTILFVSHDMSAVQRLCSRCIYLSEAKIRAVGEPVEIISRYLQETTPQTAQYANPDVSNDPVVLRSARVLNENGVPASQIKLREPFEIEMIWERHDVIRGAYYFVQVHDSLERLVAVDNSKDLPIDNESSGTFVLNLRVKPNSLAAGVYHLTIGCYKWRKGYLHLAQSAFFFEVVAVSSTAEGRHIATAGGSAVVVLDTRWSATKLEPEEVQS